MCIKHDEIGGFFYTKMKAESYHKTVLGEIHQALA